MAHGGKREGAGRKPGTIDKRSLKLQEHLDKLKYDPVQKLVEFTRSADEQIAVRAAIVIFEATVPKLKAVEVEKQSNDSRPEALAREEIEELEKRFTIRPQAESPTGKTVH